MSRTVIKVENLSKIYRLGEVGTGTISHDLNRWWKMNILGHPDPYTKIGHTNDRTSRAEKGEVVYALKDIDFEVKEGEVLGIIGRNGAGKSTLLKILSKVTSPTTGCIKVKGRIASLLEVGTGFNPEMTGRENIYMNGTIMGMRKWEINKKLDEIVEFAGVAKYIDTPVKRYSSGMTVRLGFAIAAYLEPEILIVDEVLAVGDAEFQKKAIGKMQEVSRGLGRTVLFVSHNLASLQNLCNRGILLKYGIKAFESNISETIEKYILENPISSKVLFENQDKLAFFKEISLVNPSNNDETSSFKMGERIGIVVKIHGKRNIKNAIISIRLNDSVNNKIAAWRTNEFFDSPIELGVETTINLCIEDLNVFDGIYNFSLGLAENRVVLDYIDNAINFEITPSKIDFYDKVISKDNNLIYTPAQWLIN